MVRAAPGRRPGAGLSGPRAAVDSGTNSTRLLVVDGHGDEVTRRTTITRLGAGVDASGRLDDAALNRTLQVIAGYRDTWRVAGVADDHVRIAATSAVRDASNRDRYFDAVRELSGVEAEVLTGQEEARLSFAGAAGGVTVAGPVLVVDIGGGSTELIVGDADGSVAAAHSMQVGSVRVTERHLADDPPTADQAGRARDMIREAIGAASAVFEEAGVDLRGVRSLVGVAGTVTTLAALDAAVDSADDPALHGHVIPAGDVGAWAARLLTMTVAERVDLPAMPPGRADVIAGGVLVLDAVLARVGADAVVVSRADILDALVATLT